MLRFFRHAREIFRVIRGKDNFLKDKTAQIEAQVAQMRKERKDLERQVESRNLELLRKAVQELQNLKSTIEQAESTIAEFAENTALAAKPELEKKLKLEQRAIDENLNSIKEQIGESTDHESVSR